MPRGRQKRVSAGRRYTPTTSSRRSRDGNGPDDAAFVTAVTAVDDVNNGAMNRRATSGAPTHPRWDVASPANWSASLLRQTIEDRGMKLPSGIKKSQLLRIFLDNFDTRSDPGRNDAAHHLASSSSRAMLPPAPPATGATTPLVTPGPSTRWGIAADCNRMATMARRRQRHFPSPAITTTTHAPNWRPPTESVMLDTSPEMEPLVDVVRALQASMSAVASRLDDMDERPIAAGQHYLQQNNPSAIATPPATLHPIEPVAQVAYSLTTAMQGIERSTGISLRATDCSFQSLPTSTATTSGIPSEQLPAVETVSPAVRAAIFNGNDINLATLLMPHSELNQPRPMSSDPRLNRNLTLPEFICAFNKYRNIMCEVWNRRHELDKYEGIIVEIASKIEGTSFYEYHRAFSARSAALIQQQNVKVDWGVRDNGLFCSLFVGQKANVCSLCGSGAHLSNFCPLLANQKISNQQFPRGNGPDRQSDIQGRPRVSIGHQEICNNFNSERGCSRPYCKFLHSCLFCKGSHARMACPTKPEFRNRSGQRAKTTNHYPPKPTQ